MAKRVAASGVPNRAEKNAAMPQTVAVRRSWSREMEQLCNIVADAAAHLQGRALPAGGAAAQVGEHRAKEDGGHQQRADGLAALHGPDDIVGANALALGSFIKGYDGKARRGQQPEQPAVGTPQLGDGLYRQMERGADAAAQRPMGRASTSQRAASGPSPWRSGQRGRTIRS